LKKGELARKSAYLASKNPLFSTKNAYLNAKNAYLISAKRLIIRYLTKYCNKIENFYIIINLNPQPSAINHNPLIEVSDVNFDHRFHRFHGLPVL
jgi:hypothetical protein